MNDSEQIKLSELVLNIPRLLPSVLGFSESAGPVYFSLQRLGNKEVRDYKPFIAAYTEIKEATFESAAIKGFLKLSKYFTSENTGEKRPKINVPLFEEVHPLGPANFSLVPPIFQFGNQTSWKVATMIPAKYTLDTVPQPLDPTIKIAEIPECVVGVIKTTGLNEQIAETGMHIVQYDASGC